MVQRVDLKLTDIQYFSVWFSALSFGVFVFLHPHMNKSSFQVRLFSIQCFCFILTNISTFKYIFCVLCVFLFGGVHSALTLLKYLFFCLTYLHLKFNRVFPQLPVSALVCRMIVLLNNKSE